jgi:hypothetical protein
MTDIEEISKNGYRHMMTDYTRAYYNPQIRQECITKYLMLLGSLLNLEELDYEAEETEDLIRLIWLRKDVEDLLDGLFGMLQAWE